MVRSTTALLALAAGMLSTIGQTPPAAPAAYTYKTVAGVALKAHVFQPAGTATKRPVVVLFHGGAWTSGSLEWTDGPARDYAARGIVGASIDYRLSDRKTATPLDALDDARDAIRWVRQNAVMLGIDPARLIAYGQSAGGQLAAMTAFSNDRAVRPDALVLWSPALAVSTGSYFRDLVGDPVRADAVSPHLQVQPGAPPTIIVSGAEDVVTPDADARGFCDRMKAHGGQCELLTYEGVGHLLSRRLDREAQFRGNFDFDPKTTADAQIRIWRFLTTLGYLRSS